MSRHFTKKQCIKALYSMREMNVRLLRLCAAANLADDVEEACEEFRGEGAFATRVLMDNGYKMDETTGFMATPGGMKEAESGVGNDT